MTDRDRWAAARRTVEALVGSAAWAPARVQVRESDILRYHEAIGLSEPQFDRDGTMLAPSLFLPPFAIGGEVGIDGRRRRPQEVVIDDPGLRRRVMGGCEVRFVAPIRAGETVEASATIESVVERQGREGPMLLVTTVTEYRNDRGEPKREERWTIVHR